jgi:cell division protein FtsB
MKAFSLIHLLLLASGTIILGFLTMPIFAEDAGKVQELQRVKMIRERSTFIIFVVLLLAAQVFFVSTVAAEEGAVDSEKVERLERLIEEQQQQLESLQEQVNQLKKTATEAQTEAKEAKSVAEEAKTTVQAPVEKVVTSGQERVKLAISGWVNRAVNIVDDGKSTQAYFVDNDNAESRVRFDGTAKATDDLTIGTTIELSIAPNKAGEVSQDNEETGDVFDQRITEATLDSKHFGKLSLGKGHTASYGSATADLSRTDVISYAEISDTAGGMLFRQKNDDNLTNVRILDTFRAFNGLSRKNRVRYDTPTFYGFHLATSAISDQRYDTALYWGGQGYGFKAAGAAGFAYPNEDNTDFQYDGSFSLFHEDTGLNLTLSAGLEERDNQGDAQNLYAKVGWLRRFFSFGETAFGVDYTRSLNLPTGRDDGYSVGVAAVQQFEEYGTEIYLLYRLHSLDRDVEPSVHDINVGSIGARVKF